MKINRIINEIYVDDDFAEGPSAASVSLTPVLINRVLELSKAVKKLKVFKISEFGDYPVWLNEDDKSPWDGNIDTVLQEVTDSDVRWSGYLKHTNVHIATNDIPISELLEIKKVLETPDKDLPLLINDLKTESAKSALHQRLTGEKS